MLKIQVDKIVVAIAAAVPAPPMAGNVEWCKGCNAARSYIAEHVATSLNQCNENFDRRAFLSLCGLGE